TKRFTNPLSTLGNGLIQFLGGAQAGLNTIFQSTPTPVFGTSLGPGLSAPPPVPNPPSDPGAGGAESESADQRGALLQRLFEEGPNPGDLGDIGFGIGPSDDLAALLDNLDSIPGNVTFTDTLASGGALTFDCQIARDLDGHADLDVTGPDTK